jgi:hypothetical protein
MFLLYLVDALLEKCLLSAPFVCASTITLCTLCPVPYQVSTSVDLAAVPPQVL